MTGELALIRSGHHFLISETRGPTNLGTVSESLGTAHTILAKPVLNLRPSSISMGPLDRGSAGQKDSSGLLQSLSLPSNFIFVAGGEVERGW
jgi:hypothetical protein